MEIPQCCRIEFTKNKNSQNDLKKTTGICKIKSLQK